MKTEYDLCQKHCNELEKILRSLFSRENFLDYADRRLAGTEASDLGVQLHHLDIETGDITPPDISYFLPRTDFPDIPDACKSSLQPDCVLRLLNKDFENQKTDSWIEDSLDTYIAFALRLYSFDRDDDIDSKFMCPKYVGSLQNLYQQISKAKTLGPGLQILQRRIAGAELSAGIRFYSRTCTC